MRTSPLNSDAMLSITAGKAIFEHILTCWRLVTSIRSLRLAAGTILAVVLRFLSIALVSATASCCSAQGDKGCGS